MKKFSTEMYTGQTDHADGTKPSVVSVPEICKSVNDALWRIDAFIRLECYDTSDKEKRKLEICMKNLLKVWSIVAKIDKDRPQHKKLGHEIL